MPIALSQLDDVRNSNIESVRPKPIDRTSSVVQGSRIAPNRLEGRAAAKVRLRKALVNTGTSNADFARALRVDEKMVRNWTDVEHSAVPGEGDIEAGPRTVWREYIRLAAEELDESAPVTCPKTAGLVLAGEAGKIASEVAIATADGKIDNDEAAEIERRASYVYRAITSLIASVRRGL